MTAGGWVPASDPQIQDFTVHLDVKFRIDDDVFVGRPNISADRLISFIGLMEEMNDKPLVDQTGLIRSAFTLMLTSESAMRFNARLGDEEKPISMDQVNKVQAWLMEQYGMRPTTPSAPSSTGGPGPDGGTNSTPNGPVPASAFAASPQPGSWT